MAKPRLEPLSRSGYLAIDVLARWPASCCPYWSVQAVPGGLVRAPAANVWGSCTGVHAGRQAGAREASLRERMALAWRWSPLARICAGRRHSRASRGDRNDRLRPHSLRVRARGANRLQARSRFPADRRGRPLPARPLVVGSGAGGRVRPRSASHGYSSSDATLDQRAARFHLGFLHRLVVAIRPPEPIRDMLIDAMDDSADFRWQEDEQLHLTLRFIGEVERPMANDLADALARIRAHPLEIQIA